MKHFCIFVALLIMPISLFSQVDQIVGKWKTVDDKTGDNFSIVEIYKGSNGLYYGKITQLLAGSPDDLCTECTGADHNQPIVGLTIVRDMQLKSGELRGGKVLDPDNGKFYYAKIYLEDDSKLILRGSLDKAGLLGRSQTWIRK